MAYEETLSAILGVPLWLLIVILVWTLIWKGLSLWKSARKNQPIWFLALLIINTFGILEILYIYVFSEIDLKTQKPKPMESKNSLKKRRKSR